MNKTVASLCPWPVQIHRPHFTRRSTIALPAVPKGQPAAYTVVEDDVQWERILSVAPKTSKTILGHEIAADFVLHVSKNGPFMTDDARPAVWECEGLIPSAEECAEEMFKLKAYCGLIVEYADDLDRRREAGEPNVPKVTDRMKACCRFLELKRGWLTSLVNSSTTCIYCTETIPAHAVKCPKCGEVVNRARYDELRKNGGKMPEQAAV
jgi:hypothetical protein